MAAQPQVSLQELKRLRQDKSANSIVDALHGIIGGVPLLARWSLGLW